MHLSMKIILVDPNLVRSFFGNHFFFILIMMHTIENNYFLVHTKLGNLWYSVFLNVPINHKKKNRKKFDCKRKKTFFYLNFSSIVTLKKQRQWFSKTLFLELISISVKGMYFWFLLFANTCHDHELIRIKH